MTMAGRGRHCRALALFTVAQSLALAGCNAKTCMHRGEICRECNMEIISLLARACTIMLGMERLPHVNPV